MTGRKEHKKRVLCWLLCLAMLLPVLPANVLALAAEEKPEGIVTVDNVALYSKMHAVDKNVVCSVKVNTVLELVSDETLMNYDIENYYDKFYEVRYTVNGKAGTYYILYDYLNVFEKGVSQPAKSTIAVVSGLKDVETVRAYFRKSESGLKSIKFGNGARVYVKESTVDGWSKIYTGNSTTKYIKTEYLKMEGDSGTPTPKPAASVTPKLSATPKPADAAAKNTKAVAKTTVTETALYTAPDRKETLCSVPVNTLLELVSTEKVKAEGSASIDPLYKVSYQVNGKKVTCYVDCLRVNVYENGVKQPAGTTLELIQNLGKNDKVEVKYDGKTIGWLMNGAEIEVYQKTGTKAIINFNGVMAEIWKLNLATPTPTPTPTPTLSPVRQAKDGEYKTVANGTVIASTEIRTNPCDRSGSASHTVKAGEVLEIVSLEPMKSMDEGDNDTYYKIVCENAGVRGYYYVASRYVNLCEIGKQAPSYLVDAKTRGLAEGKVVYIRSSTDNSDKSNVIGYANNGVSFKVVASESNEDWTKVYINNRYGYIRTTYIQQEATLADDAKAADAAAMAKAYPNMEIIAQAYVVGTDSIAQEKKTVEIQPVLPYTYVQGEFITEEHAPQDNMAKVMTTYYAAGGVNAVNWTSGAYLEHEAATLSVVAYDEENVIFWSNGYQGYATDPTLCSAEELMETHEAGFYRIPRSMVLLDVGDTENYAATGETVTTVAEGVVTTTIGLQTVPGSVETGAVYVIPQNGTVKLVSTEQIPAEDGSGDTYYKVALKLDSTTGYLNRGTTGYYYVDSNYINVYKNSFEHPMIATAGMITGLEEGEYIEVYAKAKESSEVLGHVVNGADITVVSDIADYYSEWATVVFNSQTGYIKKSHVAYAELDKTGIPDPKKGVFDIYYTQGNLPLKEVYPEMKVIAKAYVTGPDNKVTIGREVMPDAVEAHTMLQGQQIAARYFPGWNIENLKTLYDRYMTGTSYQNFAFIQRGAYVDYEGAYLQVVAYDEENVIFWSEGYRSISPETFIVDCNQGRIQMTHPAGFYSISRNYVQLILPDEE